MDKSVLEAALSHYNSLMGWATIAVAVGIGGEYTAHFISNREKGRKAIITLVFALCVLLGVIGEYWYGSQLSTTAEQIQRTSDKEVSNAQDRLTAAESGLADAIREASAAKTAASEAYERAAKANGRAIANEKKAAQLSKDAAEAHQKQAVAELQLAVITKNQNPRWSRMADFEKALKRKPTGQVQIMYTPDDGEAYQVAMFIHSALFSSGWKPTDSIPIPPNAVKHDLRDAPPNWLRQIPPTVRAGGLPTGISIVAHDIHPFSTVDDKTPQGILVKAFLATGLGVGMGVNSDLPDDSFWIIVGPKP
jgi:hypothetical protein